MSPEIWLSLLAGLALASAGGVWARRRAARADDLAAARERVARLEARLAEALQRVPERDRRAAEADPATVVGLAAPLMADLRDLHARLDGARAWLAGLEARR
ncbi:MAG: hypothetical protein H6702_20670 [Myxococcales bacterium]|nr:hypothetical protein [Myxococcales bacterium]